MTSELVLQSLVSPAGRLLAGVGGSALLLAAARRLRSNRADASLPPLAACAILGLLLMAGAVAPGLWGWIMRTSHMTRIRWLMAGVSLWVLLVACESIRRSLLRERYALLWIGTGFLILLNALFPRTLAWISSTFGMQYVTTVVAVVFTFLILVAFHFSIALSRLEKNLTRTVQRCALLEARLERLEAASGTALRTPRSSAPHETPAAPAPGPPRPSAGAARRRPADAAAPPPAPPDRGAAPAGR